MSWRVRFVGRWLLSFVNLCKIHILHSYKDGGSREGGWFSCFFPQVLFTKRETSQVGVPRSSRKNYEKPLGIFEQQHCFVLKISRYDEIYMICIDMPWSVITMSQIGKSWKSVKIFPEQVLAQFCQELVQESERTQERDLTSHIGSLLNEVRQVFARKTWTTQWFHGISSVLEAKSIRTVRSWELWKSTKSRHPADI